MERFKAYEREEFTYEEKVAICQKSDNHCCHCGKLKYIGYGATVDHFIPLHKGGSNRAINLVMLCEECNKEKGDKIMEMAYLPYLKDKHKKELSGYLNSYIEVIDYVKGNRLLACDEYTILLQNKLAEKAMQFKKNRNNPIFDQGFKYKIKLARWDDYKKICDYFEKYLKKYKKFESRQNVERNISFWMNFGCIYYLERQGEITLLTVYTVRHCEEDEKYEGIEYIPNMYVFPYYSSETVISLTIGSMRKIPEYILCEQKIKLLPVRINIMDADNSSDMIMKHLRNIYGPDMYPQKSHNQGFSSVGIIVDVCNSTEEFDNVLKDGSIEKILAFSKKFAGVEDKIKEYFEKIGDSEQIGWMIRDLLGYKYIKENNLTELAYNNRSNEEVEEILSDMKKQELMRAKARVKPSEEDRKSKREFAKLLQSQEAL